MTDSVKCFQRNCWLTSFPNMKNLATLVSIGYGFGDHHINRVIREWLEFTKDRQLMIVDPNLQQIPEILRHLAPQIELVTLNGTDYLDEIAGITRTRSESVGRRFGSWKRNNRSQADSKFDEFRRQERKRSIGKIMDVIKTLPIEDGDVDLETTRSNP